MPYLPDYDADDGEDQVHDRAFHHRQPPDVPAVNDEAGQIPPRRTIGFHGDPIRRAWILDANGDPWWTRD